MVPFDSDLNLRIQVAQPWNPQGVTAGHVNVNKSE
jgi:hypothetical protein